jgi:hypothetical protein
MKDPKKPKKVISPNSLKNLNPIKKGEVRNPTGRPKTLPKLDVLLAEVLGDTQEGKTQAKLILEALVKRAKNGDVKASALLLDRGYGKVREHIDITTNDESINKPTIQIEIIKTNNGEEQEKRG